MTPTELPAGTVYCGHCGRPVVSGDDSNTSHPGCEQRLLMEPPRYCVDCGRRLKVQVTPTGWTAECSRHGQTIS